MTWTKEDTEALRMDMVCRHCGTGRAHAEAVPHKVCEHPRFVNAASALECRAADEIERLKAELFRRGGAACEREARMADLEAERGALVARAAELERRLTAAAEVVRDKAAFVAAGEGAFGEGRDGAVSEWSSWAPALEASSVCEVLYFRGRNGEWCARVTSASGSRLIVNADERLTDLAVNLEKHTRMVRSSEVEGAP